MSDFDDLPDANGEDFETSADVVIRALRERLLLTADEFYQLEAAARQRAFTVSGVADLDVVADVWRAIDSAVETGESLEDFRGHVQKLLEDQWGDSVEDPGARIDTIFRTNVASAYGEGRWKQNSDPAVRETHPYLKFVAVMDSRTSSVCEELHGTVLPADHPFWTTRNPPLHMACRSDVVPLSEAEAKEEGIDEEAPDTEADEGFGVPGATWEPDLDSRPPEIAAVYELKELGK